MPPHEPLPTPINSAAGIVARSDRLQEPSKWPQASDKGSGSGRCAGCARIAVLATPAGAGGLLLVPSAPLQPRADTNHPCRRKDRCANAPPPGTGAVQAVAQAQEPPASVITTLPRCPAVSSRRRHPASGRPVENVADIAGRTWRDGSGHRALRIGPPNRGLTKVLLDFWVRLLLLEFAQRV